MKRSLDPMEPMETSDLGVKDNSKDTISSTHRNKRRKNRRRNKETPKPNNTEDPYGTIEYDNELFFKYYQVRHYLVLEITCILSLLGTTFNHYYYRGRMG